MCCGPGAVAVRLWACGCRSLGLCKPVENEQGGGKGNNGVHPEYLISFLCSGWAFPLHASSLRQPPPQGHTLPRARCLEAQRLSWAPGSTADKQVRGA